MQGRFRSCRNHNYWPCKQECGHWVSGLWKVVLKELVCLLLVDINHHNFTLSMYNTTMTFSFYSFVKLVYALITDHQHKEYSVRKKKGETLRVSKIIAWIPMHLMPTLKRRVELWKVFENYIIQLWSVRINCVYFIGVQKLVHCLYMLLIFHLDDSIFWTQNFDL